MGQAVGESVVSCYLVFNHHALPCDHEQQAVDAVPEFLRVCVRAQRLGLNVLLVDDSMDASWFRLELANGFFWQDWYNRNKSDYNLKDLIRAFRSIATRQPYYSNEDIDLQVDLFDVVLSSDSKRYAALRAAAWHAAHLVSFPTRAPWNSTPLFIREESVDEQGEIRNATSQIHNIHSLAVLNDRESAILHEKDERIRSGSELIDNWSVLYGHLGYCGKVKEQLSVWTHNLSILEQTKESLRILDKFASQWSSSICSCYSHQTLRELGLNHEVSGESSSVLNNPSLRKFREFWLPTGSKELFENHIKLSKGFRIHFYCEDCSKKVYVGYIGPHLPL